MLLADPLCKGGAWRLLAHAGSAWDLRVAVTDVVVAEAIAGYGRKVEEALVALNRCAVKHLGALGLVDVRDAARTRLSEAVVAYPELLRASLDSANVEVVPVPDVPHMTLVGRATARRKPCDANGNGYRDTLNWFALLSLVEANKESRVLWVTDNSRDFASEDESGLHEDLIAELASITAEPRVEWFRSLVDVMLDLISTNDPSTEADITRAQEHLRDAAILQFLNSDVLPRALERAVSPRLCGLPLTTQRARIETLGLGRDLNLDLKGVSGGEPVAEFTVVVDASISATLAGVADPSFGAAISDGVLSTIRIEKPILVQGLINLGQYERPLSGDIGSIEAPRDDPGRQQWSTAGATLDAMRRASEFQMPPEVMETLRRASQIQIPPELLDTMRRASQIQIPPELLDTMRQAGETMRSHESRMDESSMPPAASKPPHEDE